MALDRARCKVNGKDAVARAIGLQHKCASFAEPLEMRLLLSGAREHIGPAYPVHQAAAQSVQLAAAASPSGEAGLIQLQYGLGTGGTYGAQL
jgi:hypothetical protein